MGTVISSILAKNVIWLAAGAALVGTVVSVAAAEELPRPSKKRFLSKPLEVCDFGSFHVGGVPKITQYASSATPGPFDQITIGQMYVQFMVPSKHRKWPLIVLHGGSHTAASLESTPDGREGWMPYGARHGIAVYGVDSAGRGRAGFDNSVINEAKATQNWSMLPTSGKITDGRAFGTLVSLTTRYGFFGHLIPDGSTLLDGQLIPHGAPGDPDGPDEHGNYRPDFPLDVIDPVIAARAGAIGPAPNPANNKLLALEYYKQLMPSLDTTLPTSSCASCNPSTVSGRQTWTARALAQLLREIGGGIIAMHSQGGDVGPHVVRLLKETGDLHLLKGLINLEALCSLSTAGLTPQDLDNIPYLAIKGDYYTKELMTVITQCIPTVAALKASPTRKAPADYVELDDPAFRGKFKGVTHMMMLGKKSNDVFDLIQDWIEKNVRNNPMVTSCRSGDRDRDDDDDDHHH